MPSPNPSSANPETDLALHDLGPLAWVLDEMRQSLDGATKALKRFVREAQAALGSELADVDTSHLRIARQQLHQAVGALEMVGLAGAALILRAMESAVQKFIEHPQHCTQQSASKIEQANFALIDYLEGVLANKSVSAVCLFPQYRDVQELVGADRIHPADLWTYTWSWQDPVVSLQAPEQVYGDEVSSLLDRLILQIIKGDAAGGQLLSALSLGLAQHSPSHARIFWKIVGAYFEAIAGDLLPLDIYVRRTASRILMQYASLAKGDPAVSERLAQDLLFFCAQAASDTNASTPLLAAVRQAYGLNRFLPVDYSTVQLGRFDPALLAQAKKRIHSSKEIWAALSGGELSKLKAVKDQFFLVTDSLLKLHPPSQALAQALGHVVDSTVRAAQIPRIELAMEVATALLYLEAMFEDLNPNDPESLKRTNYLADRLEGVKSGAHVQPLEPWMEDLYRHFSDKNTMGSVVGELKSALAELEKSLDMCFRDPNNTVALQNVPGQLAQMRGVFSVLGLDHASHAVQHMKSIVEVMLSHEASDKTADSTELFNNLGHNLSALSFLIDMLNYQPALAKKLFVYDEKLGELKPLMGRVDSAANTVQAPHTAPNANALSEEILSTVQSANAAGVDARFTERLERLDSLASRAELAGQPALAQTAREASLAVSSQDAQAAQQAVTHLAVSPPAPTQPTESADLQEDDLRDIFIEEALEVIANGQEAIAQLQLQPADIGQLTVLRRAFHTLKGSSRMVGLGSFGDAAWSLEQLLNTWLADQKSTTAEFRTLTDKALQGFSDWIADIRAQPDNHAQWSAVPFSRSADAMRTESRFVPLALDAPLASAEASFATAMQLQEQYPTAQPDSLDGAFDEVKADFSFAVEPDSFSNLPALQSPAPLLEDLPTLSTDALTVGPAPAIEAIDFDSLAELSSSYAFELAEVAPALPQEEPPGDTAANFYDIAVAESSSTDLEAEFLQALNADQPDLSGPVTEAAPEDLNPLADLLPSATVDWASEKMVSDPVPPDDQIKVIDGLRISLGLYNVYLNEADEWSRRLLTEISEWALEEPHRPISDSTIALAHSLGGSSATVGFTALSEIARALEHALQQLQNHARSARAYAQLFIEAAEDIRRLLHQFAAGFLKSPQDGLLTQLRELDFPDSMLSSVGPQETLSLASFDSEPEPVVVLVNQPESGAFDSPTPDKTFAQAPLLNAPLGVVHSVAKNVTSFSDKEEIWHAAQKELDATDAIDVDLFPIFEEEAAELMPQLGGALRQWAARPENHGAKLEVLRTLHTLKGSARLAGALRLGELAHLMESEIENLGSEAVVTASVFDALLARFDAMDATFEALRQATVPALMGQDAVAQTSDQPATVKPSATFSKTESTSNGNAASATLASNLASFPSSVSPVSQAAPTRPAASASIRVRSHFLDRMVNQAGEVMMTRSRLEAEMSQLRISMNDMSGNLSRLRQHLRDIELQAETQMQSRLAQAKEAQAGFDPLEFDRFTRVQELTRMMAESVNDVATVQRNLQRTVAATEDDLVAQARQTRELQNDLLRTRMVEFEGISDRLYRVVRQASKETGKQVRLDLLGATIEMDRGILDRMTPAFEHLLRNCVAHGIESTQARVAAGKDPAGLITVHLRQEGNDVSVSFSDDGAGLDLPRIREKAVSLGLITPAQSLDDEEAANLIFMPGFSTAAQVTELAGRGIGMDVVRAEVHALGGKIETSSTRGQGTHFKLVLPLTTAVTQVVMLRIGNLSIGVPANLVETVRRISAAELQSAYAKNGLDFAGETLAFFWAGSLLQSSTQSQEAQTKTSAVVIFRSAAQRVALHVDEVLGNQEVVVKNLGPQLSRLPGLAALSVLPSGAVVLIYNPVALATVYGQQARGWKPIQANMPKNAAEHTVSAGSHIPLVLVVDDSITVRRVTQRLLQRDGYRVALAADGLQALERLQEERPAVVLSDIEMPRMDGFDLARNIRADLRLHKLPIIMITSRIAQKHREHAKELGVDHYLGKPYSEEELMGLVRRYCQAEVLSEG